MKRVVVGTDGSPHATRAIAVALEEARLRGADLCVLATYDAHPVAAGQYLGDELRADLRGLVRRTAAAALASARALAPGAETVMASVETREGSAAHWLVTESAAGDLLVVGSHGAGAFLGSVYGSVCAAVLLLSDVPVLVVPLSETPQPVEQVVAVVDLSPDAAIVLHAAVGQARLRRIPLRILHVVTGSETLPLPLDPMSHAAAQDETWAADEERLHALLDREDTAGLALTVSLADGNPRHVVTSLTSEATLVVTGDRQVGLVHRLLRPSVSRHAATHTRGPLLVVPTGRTG